MRIDLVASKYVQFKRSLGMVATHSQSVLRQFCKGLKNADIQKVEACHVLAFLKGEGLAPASGYYHYHTLNAFYRFAVGRGYIDKSPLPCQRPKRRDTFRPYIYSHRELEKLIDLAPSIESPWRPVTGRTFRVLLILIYGAGLRVGEALHLRSGDVNWKERLIMIRESKFHKTRLLPIGPKLAAVLQSYFEEESRRRRFLNEGSWFFVTRQGKALSIRGFRGAFLALLTKARISRSDGGRYGPRVHDLRHSFAVHELLSWYREGKDVQRLLPLLSTYLGHLSIEETKVYLSMTPELLSEANKRFEKYALKRGGAS